MTSSAMVFGPKRHVNYRQAFAGVLHKRLLQKQEMDGFAWTVLKVMRHFDKLFERTLRTTPKLIPHGLLLQLRQPMGY